MLDHCCPIGVGETIGEQFLGVAARVGQLDIDACMQRDRARLGRRSGDQMHRFQEGDRPIVRDDGAVESPFTAQHVGQEPPAGCDGHTVYLGVRVHHRARAGAHRHLEWNKHDLTQLAGELVPGERLKEAHLAQRLGVSRPTLREAIYQLIHEGLLVQETYKGVTVAQMNAASITDVAVVREALETIAAQTIAADKTGRRQEVLKLAWRDYQDAARSNDPVRAHEAHLHLHRTIWLASENSILQRIWPIIDATINLAVSTDQATRADLARAHEVHARLVEAILNNKQ